MANRQQFEHRIRQTKENPDYYPILYKGFVIRKDKGFAINYATGVCLNTDIYNKWLQLKIVIDAIK